MPFRELPDRALRPRPSRITSCAAVDLASPKLAGLGATVRNQLGQKQSPDQRSCTAMLSAQKRPQLPTGPQHKFGEILPQGRSGKPYEKTEKQARRAYLPQAGGHGRANLAPSSCILSPAKGARGC